MDFTKCFLYNKKMKNKWYQSPIFISIMCLLCFPIGLVLLGSSQKANWFSKILLSLTYVVIILVFFMYYEPVPRKRTVSYQTASTEDIRYNIKRVYKKDSLLNGLMEAVQPSKDEFFLCIDIDVTNEGEKTVFFISLVDDPKVESGRNKYYPDLTLSQDPFGDIDPKKTVSGYLVFRIPKSEKSGVFRISNQTRNIDF